MKLSDIDTSVYYETELPSTGKKVQFRPFTVKEEKALLTSQESAEVATMISTLNKVVQDCVIKCPPLSTFDVEYLFIKIRSKSVGEESQIIMKCVHCGTSNHVNVDLNQVKVNSEISNKKLIINKQLAVIMRYPTLDDVVKISTCATDDQVATAIAIAIETIYFGDKVFHTKDSDISDIIEFIMNRTDTEIAQMIEFVEKIPSIELPIEFECRQCMKVNEIVVKSITDFF